MLEDTAGRMVLVRLTIGIDGAGCGGAAIESMPAEKETAGAALRLLLGARIIRSPKISLLALSGTSTGGLPDIVSHVERWPLSASGECFGG
jgi:hypothetical protein